MTLANCRSIAQYLAACNHQKFTGTLCVRSETGTLWSLRFFIGRVIAEAGGASPVRRWERHLLKVVPSFDWQEQMSSLDLANLRLQWNTELLENLFKQDCLDRRQAKSVLRGSAIEVLFDIALEEERASANQTPLPTVTSIPCSRLAGDKSVMMPLDVDDIWESASNQLERWVEANGKYHSPNLVPKIVLPELLEKLVSPDIWQLFSQLMDGSHSLRDVAAVLGKTIDMTYLSVCPFILAHAIRLGPELDVITELNPVTFQCLASDDVASARERTDRKADLLFKDTQDKTVTSQVTEVPDDKRKSNEIEPADIELSKIAASQIEPESISPSEATQHVLIATDNSPAVDNDNASTQTETQPKFPHDQVQYQQPKIAYIDSNSIDSQRMQATLSNLGCTDVIAISESNLAIAALLDSSPDLVLIGLKDACEVCISIHRCSPLKHIPVAIVGHTDGVLERFRAKLAGAIEFVSKPVTEDAVALILHRYYGWSQSTVPRSFVLTRSANTHTT